MSTTQEIAVLTGATSGFGKVIAEHLVAKNYSLFFLARSEIKALTLKESLMKQHPQANVNYVLCDLSSFSTLHQAIQILHEKCGTIDLLILNAGLWNFDYTETEDGIEETLQVNLLAPTLLFLKLKDLLSAGKNTKIIFTASGLHQGNLQFDDLEFKKKFSGFKAYRQSKLGIILITRLLAQLSEYANFSFYCVHPGVVNTELGKNANWFSQFIFRMIGKSVQEGAKTHLYLIDQPASRLKSGAYYANAKVTQTTSESNDMEKAGKLFDKIKEYLRPN